MVTKYAFIVSYGKHLIARTALIGTAILLMGQHAAAQEEDFGGRYSFGIKKTAFNWLDISISPEIRTFDNHSRLDSWLLETDLSAKLHEYLKIGGLYRYSVDYSNPEANKRVNRYALYGKSTYRIKPFDLSYRCQFQQQYSNYHSSENGKIPDMVWRHKVQVQYSKKKYDIEPYVYGEFFYTVSPKSKEGGQKLRLSGGVDYKINKLLSASVGYIRQTEYNVKNPLTSHILITQINVKLK